MMGAFLEEVRTRENDNSKDPDNASLVPFSTLFGNNIRQAMEERKALEAGN